jgi:N-methylhydantoinase A
MAGRTIGVDTGGTFTDLVELRGGEERVHKLPSTPDDPARAVTAGLAHLGGTDPGTHLVHGTTVGLNALLQRRVARTAFVTNRDFLDLIEIGRQARPDIYDLAPRKAAPLAPRELRFGVDQRTWPAADGSGRLELQRRPTAEELSALVQAVAAARPEAIAIGLLHSYADPSSEREVAEALRPLGVPITCSGELLAEHREFERFTTALVNAALTPLLAAYLSRLSAAVAPARLSVLGSRGGTLSAERAAQEPVRVLVSGPAGGVIGAVEAAREIGVPRLIALDLGGTSADVAFGRATPLAPGEARATVDRPEVGGLPIAVPCLDLHTIGCGGGSLARIDAGGALQVGPESAGADPGPVCYGRSTEPTVTDAHLQLGHLDGGRFLGGALELDRDGVARAFEELGARLGVSAVAAAQAVLDSARAAMRRAVAVMTLERGQDPRELPLLAFGGAGGLHAAALARDLGCVRALVPRHPGALSAWGMTRAVASAERVETVLEPLARWPRARRRQALAALGAQVRAELSAAPGRGAVDLELELDLRYRGQSYELCLAERGAPEELFHGAHAALYGYRLDEREVELVCLRVRGSRRAATAAGPERGAARPRPLPRRAVVAERRAYFGRWLRCPVIDRAALLPGHHFEGPALIEEFSGTTAVPPACRVRVLPGGHLSLESGAVRR